MTDKIIYINSSSFVKKKINIVRSYYLQETTMVYLNQTYELLTGGYYSGNISWNKQRSEIDNCFKLYQITDGEVHVCNDTGDFLLQSGKLYFINGNKLGKQYCNKSFSTHWLHFMPKDLLIYQGLMSLPLVVELPVNSLSVIQYQHSMDRLLRSNEMSAWEYTLSVLQLQSYIQQVTCQLFDLYPIKELSVSEHSRRIEPAIHYINQYYKETIPLQDLAQQCCMSPNYFHKIFKQIFCITPFNYQMLLRMNSALQLLTDKEQTIKDIAFELGFTDNAHFCKTFKKFYGVTPGEYQRNKQIILL